MTDKTLAIIKPDAVKRNLIGQTSIVIAYKPIYK